MDATDKQINFILMLWNRQNGGSARFLSQTDIPMSRRARCGGLTRAEASEIINDLKVAA